MNLEIYVFFPQVFLARGCNEPKHQHLSATLLAFFFIKPKKNIMYIWQIDNDYDFLRKRTLICLISVLSISIVQCFKNKWFYNNNMYFQISGLAYKMNDNPMITNYYFFAKFTAQVFKSINLVCEISSCDVFYFLKYVHIRGGHFWCRTVAV